MERFIADLVKNFESGTMDRREFCQTVALAAVVYGAGEAANAQAGRGFKVLGINHISYSCPDYTKARDFYISVLGMESAPGRDNGKRASLMFGPPPGKGGSFMGRTHVPGEGARAGRRRSHLLHDFQLERGRRARRAEGEESRRDRPRRQPSCL